MRLLFEIDKVDAILPEPSASSEWMFPHLYPQWRRASSIRVMGKLIDSEDRHFRIGSPVEIRRRDGSVLTTIIICVPYCGEVTTGGRAEFTLPYLDESAAAPGDELWVGERTRNDLHRAFVDSSFREPRQPAGADELDAVEAALNIKLPAAYRHFLSACGTGIWSYDHLSRDSWHCDPEAHGSAPVVLFPPDQVVAHTRAFQARWLPRDSIVIGTFGAGFGIRDARAAETIARWERGSLVALRASSVPADDGPVCCYDWPYLAPGPWPWGCHRSFDEFLAAPLDAMFQDGPSEAFNHFRQENFLDLGREVRIEIDWDCIMIRYWSMLTKGRRYRVDLWSDTPGLVPWLHVQEPGCEPTLVGQNKQTDVGVTHERIFFTCRHDGRHYFDGCTFAVDKRSFTGRIGRCVMRIKVDPLSEE